MKILVLCTGNSCRSQMAEGFLNHFAPNLKVYSAGMEPAQEVHPKAMQVMKEIGIDISNNKPKPVERFLSKEFHIVITVCGHANEICPPFPGKSTTRLHFGFEDPAKATGTEQEILNEFRRVRNRIKEKFYEFYQEIHANYD